MINHPLYYDKNISLVLNNPSRINFFLLFTYFETQSHEYLLLLFLACYSQKSSF